MLRKIEKRWSLVHVIYFIHPNRSLYYFQGAKKLSADLDASRSNCLDLERAERQVRVDLQQLTVKVRSEK